MSNGVFNFNFLALLLSETLGVSQIYTSGPTPPGRALALVASEILGGPKCTLRGAVTPPLYAP